MIVTKLFKCNVDKRLHKLMRELTLRKRPATKKSIADQYRAAIEEYLQDEKIPKQLEAIERTSLRFMVDDDFLKTVEALRLIAKKRKQSFSVVLESIIERYLEKPENYLGKTFYEKHKKHVVKI